MTEEQFSIARLEEAERKIKDIQESVLAILFSLAMIGFLLLIIFITLISRGLL